MNDLTSLLNPRTEKFHQQAPFFRRALAFILDLLVLDIFVTSPFSKLFVDMIQRVEQFGPWNLTYTPIEYATVLGVFVVVFSYFVIFEYVLGQTIGMMVLKTKVNRPKLWQAIVRNSFLIPIFPFVLLWIIEPLTIIFFKRSVLERISRTRTVHIRKVMY